MDFGSVVGFVVLAAIGLTVITWKNWWLLRDAHPRLRFPVLFLGVALAFIAFTLYEAIIR